MSRKQIMTVMPANHERPLSRNLHMAAIGACWIALCAALAQTSPALASEQANSNTPHPALADCKSEWNDSSAKATCRNATFDTEPGNCVITAECKRRGVFDMMERWGDCTREVITPITGDPQFHHWCPSTVTFPLTVSDIHNCDGTLQTSSC